MRKPIFENEEEFISFYQECILNMRNYEGMLRQSKQAGYIRRSPVEEAEEMYKHYMSGGLFTGIRKDIIHIQHEAIQYQKEIIKQLEEK